MNESCYLYTDIQILIQTYKYLLYLSLLLTRLPTVIHWVLGGRLRCAGHSTTDLLPPQPLPGFSPTHADFASLSGAAGEGARAQRNPHCCLKNSAFAGRAVHCAGRARCARGRHSNQPMTRSRIAVKGRKSLRCTHVWDLPRAA